MHIRSLGNFPRLLKQIGIVIFVFYWVSQVYPQDMEFDWAKRAGGTSNSWGYAIAVSSSGNVYVTGSFDSSATFGSTTLTSAGDKDIFIAKLDASGNFLWVKQVGGPRIDGGYGIAIDDYSGNFYVTGDFCGTVTFGSTTLTSAGNQDVFIAKLDDSGNFLWTKQAGGQGGITKVFGISVVWNVYVTGYFRGTVTFGSTTLTNAGNYDDIFIAQLNDSGDFLWAKQAGGNRGDAEGCGIAVDHYGNLYVIGYFQGPAQFGSTTLISNSTSVDIFIAKLNTLTGYFLWVKQAGGSLDDYGCGIAVDDSENVYVTGNFAGTAKFGSTTLINDASNSDIFIAKLDVLADFLWAKQAGGLFGMNGGSGVAVDGSGNVYVTGRFSGTATFGSITLNSVDWSDIFMVKLNASGNLLSVKQAGGSEGEYAHGIAVDGSGNVYVTGYFYGTATFGSTTLTSAGETDIFIAKLVDLTSVESDKKEVITEFKLFQNYPNPFNPETVIKYQITEPSQVAIQIYDLQGREIMTLVSEQKEVGYYSTVWNGRDQHRRMVSNGIYLCRLKAGSYTQTIRMIFIK